MAIICYIYRIISSNTNFPTLISMSRNSRIQLPSFTVEADSGFQDSLDSLTTSFVHTTHSRHFFVSAKHALASLGWLRKRTAVRCDRCANFQMCFNMGLRVWRKRGLGGALHTVGSFKT